MIFFLDRIDRKILEFLLQDARTPFSSIANHLLVSVDTVSKRYAKLKKDNIIRSATLFLDVGKIGGGLVACFNISVTTGHRSEVEDKLLEVGEIFLMGKTFGAYDFFALASAANLESLDLLRGRISGIHQIKLCDVSIVTSGLTFMPGSQLPQEAGKI
jgi:Lrp/AsnC family transcriptional regulator, regulator for asnA, asnC and gidA